MASGTGMTMRPNTLLNHRVFIGQAKREKIGRFVYCLEKLDGPLMEFNEDDRYRLENTIPPEAGM